MSQNRIWLFRLISALIGLAVALIMSELILHVYAGRAVDKEHMDPGLIQYHSKLGWKLASGWRGMHRHIDYEVEYNTDIKGLRRAGSMVPNSNAEGHRKKNATRHSTLVFGDSFTFGLGVSDHETFVARLNQTQGEIEYINGGVPGYAPDQVLLWSENAVRLTNPDHFVFVLYLGNDLVDLGLPFPVQAAHGKPFAAVDVDDSGLEKLVLRNIPVPMQEKPPALKQQTLGSYLLGGKEGSSRYGLRVVDLIVTSFKTLDAETISILQQKIDSSLELFELVYVDFLRRNLSTNEGATATLVLLPGASYVKEPDSVAGVYQSLASKSLIKLASEKSWALVDLGSGLNAATDEPLYFPNDGHLTPVGHQVVADLLRESF